MTSALTILATFMTCILALQIKRVGARVKDLASDVGDLMQSLQVRATDLALCYPHTQPASPRHSSLCSQGESVFLRVDESFSSIFDGRYGVGSHAFMALPESHTRLATKSYFVSGAPIMDHRNGPGGG